MQRVTWTRAAAWRVQRHHLDRRAPAGSLLAVASRLCGLHAQVLSCSELTLWARVEGLERKAVRQALWEDRSLIKTWAMRGTLHLLPASELPLWHAALATSRRYDRPKAWKNFLGITMEELEQLTVAIGEALRGRVLTREELIREVGRITGSAAFTRSMAENSWGTILKPAAFTGRLCFAPSVGQRVQFTRPESWLSGTPHAAAKPVETEEAIATVARRYLAAYGPATTHDLARWWGGGGVSMARKWIAALGDEVVAVDLAGTEAWMLAKDARELRELKPARSARLLPGFDQYVIGASRHAANLLPGDLRSRVYRPQGWISPVLLVNGRMEGTWRHELKGSRVGVTIEPFVKVDPWVKRAAGAEAERLAEFLGGTARVVWAAMAAERPARSRSDPGC